MLDELRTDASGHDDRTRSTRWISQLAMLGTIAFSTVGMGSEVLLAVHSHHAPGMTWTILAICNYALWSTHGIVNQDKFVLFANTPGLLMGLLLLFVSLLVGR